MSVNSKMTAIADKIRSLLGINGKLGLDTMDTNLESANTEVTTQEELMKEILTTLAEKSANTGGSAKPEQEKTVDIIENGTTEVLPDSGKVLSKVTVNVDVQSGGGSDSSGEIITVASSVTNVLNAYDLFYEFTNENEKIVIFKTTKSLDEVVTNNYGIYMIINRIIPKDDRDTGNGACVYMRKRTSSNTGYQAMVQLASNYDFILNVGDVYEKVVIL